MRVNLASNPYRARVLAIALMVGGFLVGCSGAGGTSSKASVVASPTPDSVTQKYVALVHDYWTQYVRARGDGATVCWNAAAVDPPKCRERAVAILAVHQKFLSDLDTTPPSPNFVADDQSFRSQLPKAIAQVKAMISAAESGDKQAVVQATTAYVNDMIPTVTNSLDHVDPSVVHA
jgi:hypothetical protein